MSLTNEERISLLNLSRTPGWQVLLDLMEQECTKAETEHFQVKPEEEAKVIASHNTARAMRVFFERVQKAVYYELNELNVEANAPISSASTESVEYITGLMGEFSHES